MAGIICQALPPPPGLLVRPPPLGFPGVVLGHPPLS